MTVINLLNSLATSFTSGWSLLTTLVHVFETTLALLAKSSMQPSGAIAITLTAVNIIAYHSDNSNGNFPTASCSCKLSTQIAATNRHCCCYCKTAILNGSLQPAIQLPLQVSITGCCCKCRCKPPLQSWFAVAAYNGNLRWTFSNCCYKSPLWVPVLQS